MSGTRTERTTAGLFAALGDATRLQLVARLSEEGPQPIARLAEGTAITRQAVAKHLQAMQRAGLLRSRRSGRERIFELRAQGLGDARRHLDRIEARWDVALRNLRQMVEGGH